MSSRLSQASVWRHFWLGNAVVVAIWLILSMSGAFEFGAGGAVFAVGVGLGYGVLYVLAGWLTSRLLGQLSVWMARGLAVLLATILFFMLYVDGRIFAMYGFHINGFVWNLLTTPGGFESLGSSSGAELDAILRFVGLVALEAVWLAVCVWLAKRQWGISHRVQVRLLWAWVAVMICCQLGFGFGRILHWQPAYVMSRSIPVFFHTRVRGLASSMGIQVVRDDAPVHNSGHLDYPLAPIQSGQQVWSPNFIWLVSESLRADMLTPEIMPNLWKFAKGAHRFTDHYSGGNGTRQGVFSMFYSLPANYWYAFLHAQREPVFIKLLQHRHYQFGLYTSSAFTYPEFNRTLFADFPASELHAYNQDATWQNDEQNTTALLNFVTKAMKKPQPFFAFMFFNSPHARYWFPKSSIIRPNYLKHFNYAREDVADIKRDIKKIKNRYVNSVHFLDTQLGRIFRYVKTHHLKKDTIILITGDHAEEFMDEGRWGHNSELHNAQLHTPMVLWIPGKGSGVHHYPTSHLDFITTIMPLMGVTTPVADYSEGANLLHPPKQRFRLAASINDVAYIGNQYKIVIPYHKDTLAGIKYLQANDQPIADLSTVRQTLQPKMKKLLTAISRFYQ